MHRLLILLGLIPVFTGIFLYKWFGAKTLKVAAQQATQLTAYDFLCQLKENLRIEVQIEEAKYSRISSKKLVVARSLGGRSDVLALAEGGLLVGRFLLGVRQPELLRWRDWAEKFSWAVPVFTVIVLLFSVAVGHLARWAFPIGVLGLGLGVGVGFLVAWIDLQAANLISRSILQRAALNREDERIAVTKAMRALATRYCIPRIKR